MGTVVTAAMAICSLAPGETDVVAALGQTETSVTFGTTPSVVQAS
jgi:hypothetical protein